MFEVERHFLRHRVSPVLTPFLSWDSIVSQQLTFPHRSASLLPWPSNYFETSQNLKLQKRLSVIGANSDNMSPLEPLRHSHPISVIGTKQVMAKCKT